MSWHLPSDNHKLVTLPEKYHEILCLQNLLCDDPAKNSVSACVNILLVFSLLVERVREWKGKTPYSESTWFINMV